MTHKFIRKLLFEAQGRVDATDKLPDHTTFQGVPNYPIKYVDTNQRWAARYDPNTQVIEFDEETARELLKSRDTRHGADAISAGLAHEAAHGWWHDAGAGDKDLRKLHQIPASGDLGQRYDLGPVHVRTPKDERLYERAIEVLAAYHLNPDRLNGREREWARGIMQRLGVFET